MSLKSWSGRIWKIISLDLLPQVVEDWVLMIHTTLMAAVEPSSFVVVTACLSIPTVLTLQHVLEIPRSSQKKILCSCGGARTSGERHPEFFFFASPGFFLPLSSPLPVWAFFCPPRSFFVHPVRTFFALSQFRLFLPPREAFDSSFCSWASFATPKSRRDPPHTQSLC